MYHLTVPVQANRTCIRPVWGRGAGRTARCALPWCSRSCWPGCGRHPGGCGQLPSRCTGSAQRTGPKSQRWVQIEYTVCCIMCTYKQRTKKGTGHEKTKWKGVRSDLGEVCEVMGLCDDFHSEVGAVIWAEGVAEHLKENSYVSLFFFLSRFSRFN